MTGEMLAAWDYAAAAQTFAPGQRHCNHSVRCCAKGSIADDWVFGIGIDIQDRSKIQIDAEDGEFGGNSATDSKGEIGTACFADRSRGRKMGERRRETVN